MTNKEAIELHVRALARKMTNLTTIGNPYQPSSIEWLIFEDEINKIKLEHENGSTI